MSTEVERVVRRCEALAPWFDRTSAHRLWVGFSGGMDSTVLLHALRDLAGVHAVHLDHGLNPASERWSRHCAVEAGVFGVPLTRARLRVERRGNLAANARRARYAEWRRLLAAGDVLVLAHHADDQAETRLWQLLTGRAAGGMPAARDLGEGRLARPLLTLRRCELAAHADHYGLRWIEDPSNANVDFDRSYIRHRLLPIIERRFPAAVERLAAPRPSATETPAPLAVANATEPGIEAWLWAAGKPVARRVVAEIRRQSTAAPDRAPRVAVTRTSEAVRYRGFWHLVRKDANRAQGALQVVSGVDEDLPHGRLSWQVSESGLPAGSRYVVRPRRGGERIRPAGRDVTKSVKDLFREAGIPPWQRQRWPLLYDVEGTLAAVPGLAVAARVATADALLPRWTPRAAV